MRSFLRILGVLLLVVLVVAGGLIAFAPREAMIQRSLTINAPQQAVFEQMSKYSNWGAWTRWAEMDPNMKVEITGPDGAPGARYHWLSPEDSVGEGMMTTTDVANGVMKYKLDFIKPFEGHNTGLVQAEPTGAGQTKAVMELHMNMPRPFNAFAFLFGMKKVVGKDLDHSLAKLKSRMENSKLASSEL
jgi:hypothetical protein